MQEALPRCMAIPIVHKPIFVLVISNQFTSINVVRSLIKYLSQLFVTQYSRFDGLSAISLFFCFGHFYVRRSVLVCFGHLILLLSEFRWYIFSMFYPIGLFNVYCTWHCIVHFLVWCLLVIWFGIFYSVVIIFLLVLHLGSYLIQFRVLGFVNLGS